ncbi:MAG: FdhF/YdeP family oxidoreductase [Bacteroidales bacterium]|nr:FdhF/YdeP family oxidoreductase [Bacteroidales bacterium]
MTIGGGFKAIRYSAKAANKVGYRKMFQTILSKNTCKTCALGMGGQKGGMTDEMGNRFEVCKKSFQAQITDIQNPIADELFQDTSIEDFKRMSAQQVEACGRLNSPLYKAEGDSHYSIISWEHAIDRIVRKFKAAKPERSLFYGSGRSSNEAAFLLQLFARTYGCDNISNSSYYCHQASGAGIASAIGTGTATIMLEDLEKTDLIFVIGANPASNHPRFIRQLLNCRRRGGHVIIVNPIKEKGLVKFAVPSDFKSMVSGGSQIASHYLQIQIGGDIALLKGIAKAVIEDGKQDLQFMEDHTNGKEDYLEDIINTTWESIVLNSGISKQRIKQIADIYGRSENVVFSWAVGITHHIHGVENVESIVNLALLRGMIGKRFAGLLPLRGHSNVQGIGSVGLKPGESGMDTMSSMKASFDAKIDLAFLLGGNLLKSNPDTKFAEKALNTIPFKMFLTTTLNQGHFFGVEKEVLILPVKARDEELQKTTQESMFNYVRLSDGGIERLNNVRSEIDIISEIAQKVMGNSTIDFEKLKLHKNLRKLISEKIPGYEKLSEIDETGEEFQIPNRTFHKPQFATYDSKANFRICSIPSLQVEDDEFHMMTIRSEGQFNTVVYEEDDLYREQASRWIVLMNKDDIQSRGLQVNDLVTLTSSVGRMEKLRVRELDIPSGNIASYFPESNVLVPVTTDPRSHTPAYKHIRVRLFVSSD